MLIALYYWYCAFSTVKKCCAKKGCALVVLTLFWRKLHYVANYAFLVLFVGSKIFICAILYAFSISVEKYTYRFYIVGPEECHYMHHHM